jgi:hypothetical protein
MVQLESTEELRPWQFALSSAQEHFTLRNVPPGDYWLVAKVNQGATNLATRRRLRVGNSDVDGLELSLAPAPEIPVAIHAPPRNTQKISVSLRDASNSYSGAIEAQPGTDGVLRVPVPFPGRYWLVTRTLLCQESARFGKEDVHAQPLEIREGMNETLDVTFTDRCGEFDGHTVDGGQPVSHARFLVLLTGTPEEPGDLYLDRVDDDGKFSMIGLPPGTYSVWVWPEEEEWAGDVASLRELAGRQTLIAVKAGEKTDAVVPIMKGTE